MQRNQGLLLPPCIGPSRCLEAPATTARRRGPACCCCCCPRPALRVRMHAARQRALTAAEEPHQSRERSLHWRSRWPASLWPSGPHPLRCVLHGRLRPPARPAAVTTEIWRCSEDDGAAAAGWFAAGAWLLLWCAALRQRLCLQLLWVQGWHAMHSRQWQAMTPAFPRTSCRYVTPARCVTRPFVRV